MPKRRLNAAGKAEAKRQKQLEKLRRKEEAKRLKEQAAAEKKRKNAEKRRNIHRSFMQLQKENDSVANPPANAPSTGSNPFQNSVPLHH